MQWKQLEFLVGIFKDAQLFNKLEFFDAIEICDFYFAEIHAVFLVLIFFKNFVNFNTDFHEQDTCDT